MDKALRKTLYGLVFISACIILFGIIIFESLFSDYYFWFFPILILFFLMVNSGFFIFFHKSLQKSPNQFIRNFMLSTGIKLFLYFILILIYIFASPKTAVPFAVTLFITYLIFTSYDLVVMLSLIKRNKENNKLSNHLSN